MIMFQLMLGTSAALLQAAVIPRFTTDPWAAPVVASAVIAAWAVTRQPHETWPIALASALVLGLVSIERSGWFLLAMLPTVGLAMLLDAVSPRNRGLPARLGRAAAAAAAGALGYALLLALASASSASLIEEARSLALAAIATALLAVLTVAATSPFRRRPAGLFA